MNEFWTTRDGRKIKWCDLTDIHLKAIVNMLYANNHPLLALAQKEECTREVIELLRNNPNSLAWWLLSPNKDMRALAERAKKK